MRATTACTALVTLCAFANVPARAQSFNIDVGPPELGVPEASFGAAAGQAGPWFACSSNLAATNPFDVTGATPGVVLSRTGGFGDFWFGASGVYGQLLIDDWQDGPAISGGGTGGTSAVATWTFQNLSNGPYRLYTYAHSWEDASYQTKVTGVGSLDAPQTITSNSIELNEICAKHRFNVTNGTITIQITAPWPGPNPTLINRAAVDGFQLVKETTPYTVFCNGAASIVAPCPCSNTGSPDGGCRNSTNFAGRLQGSGEASVSADTAVLLGTQMPSSSSCMFVQGTGDVNGGFGAPLGDGLICISGAIIRLGTKLNSGGTSLYPDAGDVPISLRGLLPVVGGTRNYQAYYRDVNGPCGSHFNLTNAVAVTWIP